MGGGANEKADFNHISVTTTAANSWEQSGCGVSVTSGTLGSFNNHSNGSQNFTNAIINSGKNSGHNQAGHENSTRIIFPNRHSHCSGTHSSFNCYERGSQNFSGAIINSGENSGSNAPPRSGSGPTPTSEQQGRITVTGTRDSFNNYGNGRRSTATTTLVGNWFKKLQNFKDAKINSGQNSGDT